MDGLRFTCVRGCTRCCERDGFIYLTEEDTTRIAAFQGMSQPEFEARHVYRTRRMRRLRMKDGKCPFLLADGCSIHAVKPTQCRLFPFWPELVEDRKEWARAGRYCPGIGTGKLIQIGTAVERAAEMKTAYPSMYE